MNMNQTEERALALLAQGMSQEITANALGVSASAISQLISDDVFSEKLALARWENLKKHNERDNKYDSMEDSLLEKLEASLEFIYEPMKLAKLLQVVNAAKRRGSSTPDAILAKQEIVQLVLPTQIIQHFQVNINNQVIRAGEQELITIQSGQMEKLVQERSNEKAQDVLPIEHSTPGVAETRSRSETASAS